MFYCHRNNRGAIIAAYSAPQFDYHAGRDETDPALFQYLHRNGLAAKLAMLDLSTDDFLAHRAGMFVDRDKDCQIIAAYQVAQRDGQEMVPIDEAGLQNFLARQKEEAA